jgi:hypothetical protein
MDAVLNTHAHSTTLMQVLFTYTNYPIIIILIYITMISSCLQGLLL